MIDICCIIMSYVCLQLISSNYWEQMLWIDMSNWSGLELSTENDTIDGQLLPHTNTEIAEEGVEEVTSSRDPLDGEGDNDKPTSTIDPNLSSTMKKHINIDDIKASPLDYNRSLSDRNNTAVENSNNNSLGDGTEDAVDENQYDDIYGGYNREERFVDDEEEQEDDDNNLDSIKAIDVTTTQLHSIGTESVVLDHRVHSQWSFVTGLPSIVVRYFNYYAGIAKNISI